MQYVRKPIHAIVLMAFVLVFCLGVSGCATSKQLTSVEQQAQSAQVTADKALQETEAIKSGELAELKAIAERAEAAANRAEAAAASSEAAASKCEKVFHKGMKK